MSGRQNGNHPINMHRIFISSKLKLTIVEQCAKIAAPFPSSICKCCIRIYICPASSTSDYTSRPKVHNWHFLLSIKKQTCQTNPVLWIQKMIKQSSLPHQVLLREDVPQPQGANATWRPMTGMPE